MAGTIYFWQGEEAPPPPPPPPAVAGTIYFWQGEEAAPPPPPPGVAGTIYFWQGEDANPHAAHSVLGSAVPSTGTHGPSVIYPGLDLPAEANDQFCAHLISGPTPAGLTLFDFGFDGTFEADGPDGLYSFVWEGLKNGVSYGQATAVFQLGSSPTFFVTANASGAVLGSVSAGVSLGVGVTANVVGPVLGFSAADITVQQLLVGVTAHVTGLVTGVGGGQVEIGFAPISMTAHVLGQIGGAVTKFVSVGGLLLPAVIAPSRTYTVPVDRTISIPGTGRPPPQVWIKDPDATLDYGVEWLRWLQYLNDQLAGAEVTVSVESGLEKLDSLVVNGTLVGVLLRGGNIGVWPVHFRISTLHGRVDDRTILLEVSQR